MSELFRMGVVIPLTDEAEEDIVINDIKGEDEYRYIEIKAEDFFTLYQSGFFRTINDELDTLIDEYNDEIIDHSKAKVIIKLIEKYSAKRYLSVGEKEFLDNLKELCLQASQLNRPLFFVL
ncbi:MAG: hypothetical protein F9K23_04145 [Bacteroidetes bacterium]|nr:MAG: hypothetical protein F9K23_04145 [Bacteroidota bacterium]